MLTILRKTKRHPLTGEALAEANDRAFEHVKRTSNFVSSSVASLERSSDEDVHFIDACDGHTYKVRHNDMHAFIHASYQDLSCWYAGTWRESAAPFYG